MEREGAPGTVVPLLAGPSTVTDSHNPVSGLRICSDTGHGLLTSGDCLVVPVFVVCAGQLPLASGVDPSEQVSWFVGAWAGGVLPVSLLLPPPLLLPLPSSVVVVPPPPPLSLLEPLSPPLPLSFFAKTMLILSVKGTVVIDDTSIKITNIRNIVEPYIFKDFCIKIA